uniref:Putative MYB transcription factor 1 n=1 Tax=Davidia involucrata TaxID=16924 RepID=A0A5B6YH26_DAVIN
MSRCSQCGANGHNSRTCAAESSVVSGGGGSGEIMLFGVRVKVDPMRKSVSMNDLSQYEQPPLADSSNAAAAAATGYASADDAVPHQSSLNRERKRGVPWTEEEHKLFLLGLQKVGKGDWRGISRNFVKTRTPTQVASHAQKYFLRRNNLNRRRRRSSLFDITTDSVIAIPMEEEQGHQDSTNQLETSNISGFPVPPFRVTVGTVLSPVQIVNPMENLTLLEIDQVHNASANLIHPIPVLAIPDASTMGDLNLNQKLIIDSSLLSLKLSLSSGQNQSSRNSAFQVMPSFNKGDSIITVA